ncbi:MAG: PHP domain-containing protein [Bdellovibrionaceae bacterium]|nr:PHP domain-containing protein [Bdellovibrio sp.]
MKKKYLVDLHIHSNFSDGKLTIAEIVDLYGARGFHFIAITDHLADSKTLTGYVTQKLKLSLTANSMDQYLTTMRREAQRAWQQYGMILIPGAEVTLNSWSRHLGAHLVLLGIDKYIDPNSSVENILVENSDLFSIAAHPLWTKAFEFKTTYLWQNREKLSLLFDAWECGTAQHFAKEVYLSGFPIVASSDFHGPSRFESWKTAAYIK